MSKKTITSYMGVAVGIAIIIIGFSVMNPETFLLGERDSYGLIKFGGDFYTEIYHLTYQVGDQVQKSYVNICNAIGWLIVSIGAFDICYFLAKSSDTEKNDYQGLRNENIEQSQVPTNDSSDTDIVITENADPICEEDVFIRDGKWKCGYCQAINSTNYGQCKKCGKFRGSTK